VIAEIGALLVAHFLYGWFATLLRLPRIELLAQPAGMQVRVTLAATLLASKWERKIGKWLTAFPALDVMRHVVAP
jgi:hypothetical protein